MISERIDLHVHSSASDGTFLPAELPGLAAAAGLRAIALTDHDTVSGIKPFMAAAENTTLEGIPGVEISSGFMGREVHILGLFIDPDNADLQNFLTNIRGFRNQRNELMILKLQALGYEITMEELQAAAGGESIGRPHAAGILIQKGYFKRNQDVFDHCLKRGATAYCPRKLPGPASTIACIHRAGGVAIWAHPVYHNKFARSHVRGLIRRLKELGLDGIEAHYPGFTPAQHQMLLEFAGEYDLVVSGGSDFHGTNIPDIKLGSGYGGLAVPVAVLEQLRSYRNANLTRLQSVSYESVPANDVQITEE